MDTGSHSNQVYADCVDLSAAENASNKKVLELADGNVRDVLTGRGSIDVIASIIPYDRYVTAETILSMSQVTGPVGSEFRSTETARLALQEFRRAQAEAEIRCF